MKQTEAEYRENFWSKVDIKSETECWLWKASTRRDKHGIKTYGQAWFCGKKFVASRLAWILTFEPLGPNMNALHKCDNPQCCNPNHLFEGSFKDNTHDMHKKGRDKHPKGENCRSAKLKDADVFYIRESMSNKRHTQRELSSMFSVSHASIGSIARGITWKHLGGPRIANRAKRTSLEGIKRIVNLKAQGVEQKTIARMFGISSAAVSRIIRGKTHIAFKTISKHSSSLLCAYRP